MGYGTVGSGVIEVLQTNKERIDQRAGDEIHVKYILDLRDFPGDPIQEKIVHDFQVIAEDPSIQIVVEVMGGIEPAYTFVKKCLMAGKSVVTSTKHWWQSTVQSCFPLQGRKISIFCLRPVSEAEFRSSVR